MINIMYAGNSGVFDGMLISAISLSGSTAQPISIYILTMDLTDKDPRFTPITEKDGEYIQTVIREKNPDSRVFVIDMGALYREHLDGSPNAECSYTPYAMLRLLSDRVDIIPDKILYLDTDTVVLSDISELYETDITDYEYAATRDYFGRFFFGKNYINSGVLLLNMQKIRKTGMLFRAAELCRARKIFLCDQSAINASTKKALYLPFKYNEQKKSKENTVIRHFSMTIKWFPFFHTRNIKPWNVEGVEKYLFKYDLPRVRSTLDEYINRKEQYKDNRVKEAAYDEQIDCAGVFFN